MEGCQQESRFLFAVWCCRTSHLEILKGIPKGPMSFELGSEVAQTSPEQMLPPARDVATGHLAPSQEETCRSPAKRVEAAQLCEATLAWKKWPAPLVACIPKKERQGAALLSILARSEDVFTHSMELQRFLSRLRNLMHINSCCGP